MSLGLLCQHSRIVLAGDEHAVTDFKLIGEGDDLPTAEAILNVLAWKHVRSLGNGVNDLAIDIVLQTVVKVSITAGRTAAVGYTG
jgi:hypothetical protein